jgi:hypothetical protein
VDTGADRRAPSWSQVSRPGELDGPIPFSNGRRSRVPERRHSATLGTCAGLSHGARRCACLNSWLEPRVWGPHVMHGDERSARLCTCRTAANRPCNRGDQRKRVTATSWGSSGRRFKSCQPDGNAATGELLCDFTLDPTRDVVSQGIGIAPEPTLGSGFFPCGACGGSCGLVVDDSDGEVVNQDQDAGSVVDAADADVVQASVDAQGDGSGLVDAVGAYAVVGVDAGCWVGFGSAGVDGGWGGAVG